MTNVEMVDREIDRSKMQVSDDVAIHIEKMNKWYGTFHVLRDINLTVNDGERIVICGPSGSGKSTLIRCINRLEEHQQGKIIVDGIDRRDPPRGWHVLPALQPVSPFDDYGKLYPRADLGS